jgi:flavin reductase (DIM6/NTAB) family NADH-FMN oxidoreductase RutF
MIVAEGEPSLTIGIVGTTTDLLDAIVSSERFVVHVLGTDDKRTADIFAGLFPSPGGRFNGRAWKMSDHGPVLESAQDRAYCRLVSVTESGYQRLVTGAIDRVELGDLAEPLVYFRGRYRSLAEVRDRS